MAMGEKELESHVRALAEQLPDMELNDLNIDGVLFDDQYESPILRVYLEDGSEFILKAEAV